MHANDRVVCESLKDSRPVCVDWWHTRRRVAASTLGFASCSAAKEISMMRTLMSVVAVTLALACVIHLYKVVERR